MLDSNHHSEGANVGRGYALDPRIARDLGIISVADGQVPTHNGRGIQMSEPSPLFAPWVESFHGEAPLLDIGAAYGVNTLEALRRGADVIAIDCDDVHLEYIRRAFATDPGTGHGALETVYASLPELLLPEGTRASGILCSEVIHFLSGDEVEASFRRFCEVLAPGGVLCLTCCDSSALHLDEVYCQRRSQGFRWPGELTQEEFDEFKARLQREMPLPDEAWPTYLHVFEPDKIFQLAQRAGLRVVQCGARMHPGYPEPIRGAKGRPNVQLVAVKD